MDDKTTMPSDGGGTDQHAPDGTNDPTRRGRDAGGESGGGGYADGDAAPAPKGDAAGFMGHGGQTDIAYHGSGQAGRQGEAAGNGTARTDGDPAPGGDQGAKAGPHARETDPAAEQTREERLNGRTVEVFETSGVAAAEATGMTGSAGQHRQDGDRPGSG